MESNLNNNVSIKQPTTISEQIELLLSRKLVIKDRSYAEDILSRISYYRLSAYSLHFKEDNECFKVNTSIEDIYNL